MGECRLMQYQKACGTFLLSCCNPEEDSYQMRSCKPLRTRHAWMHVPVPRPQRGSRSCWLSTVSANDRSLHLARHLVDSGVRETA